MFAQLYCTSAPRLSATQVNPIAVPRLPQSFFTRPAEVVAPELVGCLLVKCQSSGALLWGVIVETEAYCQSEPACHGHRRRTPSNETLFGEPGRFYVYGSYGIHHCVKRAVTSRSSGWVIFQRWQQRSQPTPKPPPRKLPDFSPRHPPSYEVQQAEMG